MLFVYWIEEHPVHAPRIEELHELMRSRNDSLCTSIFTVGEVLTGFHKTGADEEARRIRELLRPPLVDLVPFTAETTDRYARIRAAHRVSPADAIHLASAAQNNVNLFISNDRRLVKMIVPGIDFIAGMDMNLF